MLNKDEVQQIRELFEPVYTRLDHIESKMATKDDLKATEKELKNYIQLNNKVFDTIFKVELHDALSIFWKRIKKISEESITRFKEKDQRQDEKLENHEKRLTQLEFTRKN